MSYARYRRWSPLATRAPRPRDVSDRSWIHGLMVHTTGGTIVAKAKRLGRDPLEYAVKEYTTPGRTFAQYLIGHKGEIVQIAADTEAAWQSAWKPWEQKAYREQGWRRKWAKDYDSDVIEVPESHYRWWDDRWPRYSSPIQLSKVAAGASTLAIPNKTYCLTPETRVLTGTYEWKPISELRVGDCLPGFSVSLPKHMPLEPSYVLSSVLLRLPCVRIITTIGEVTCSRDHSFVGFRRGRGISAWLRAERLRKGDLLRFYLRPWHTLDSYDAGWLSGIIDGEGNWSKQGELIISQKRGPVLDKVLDVVRTVGFSTGRVREREDGCCCVSIIGDGTGLAVVGALRPVRMLNNLAEHWIGRRIYGKHTQRPRVLAVEDAGEQWVVALRTSSETLISEGFLSHNCGIELLDHRPFTQEQYSSLAKWIVDRSLVWTIPFTSDPFKDRVVLPTPYLLGHEDINPCRRSAPSGPWDPGDRLDWTLLLSKLITLLDMDLSEWYPPAQGA